jgi:hypothetical protein
MPEPCVAGTSISSPVCGFRAFRAARSRTSKVPKPVICTLWPGSAPLQIQFVHERLPGRAPRPPCFRSASPHRLDQIRLGHVGHDWGHLPTRHLRRPAAGYAHLRPRVKIPSMTFNLGINPRQRPRWLRTRLAAPVSSASPQRRAEPPSNSTACTASAIGTSTPCSAASSSSARAVKTPSATARIERLDLLAASRPARAAPVE